MYRTVEFSIAYTWVLFAIKIVVTDISLNFAFLQMKEAAAMAQSFRAVPTHAEDWVFES